MKVAQIKQIINDRPMNHFQILAIIVCILISMIDGYDVMTIAFVAPSISEQWNLAPEQLGLLFSAGLIGMVVGSLVIPPFADQFGRRIIILICLVILSVGMIASALSTHFLELVIARVFAGLGMGAILPGINTVIAEYSSNQYRSLMISIMAASYTVGSVIGGIIYIFVIKYFGWQYVFYLGGIFSIIMIPIVFLFLPESLDFILTKNNEQALLRLNHLLEKLQLNTCATFPKVEQQDHVLGIQQFSLLFNPAIFKATLLLCISVSMLMSSFYFLINWTPKILVNLGHSKDLSITASLIMNIIGITGGISMGWLSKKYVVTKITAIMLVMAFVFVTGFGLSSNSLPLLFSLIAFIGYTIFGAMAGLYATTPTIYPPKIRTTGTGIVLGLARLGGTLGPYVAGLLISAKLSPNYYFFILALPLLISAICVVIIKPYQKIKN